MKNETTILAGLMVVFGVLLAAYALTRDVLPGSQFVELDTTIHVYDEDVAVWSKGADAWVHPETAAPIDVDSVESRRTWEVMRQVDRDDALTRLEAGDPDLERSFWRTFGLWFAAFGTLCVFSFLYRDNAMYKFAESLVVGVSAAYTMVVAFWTDIVQKLLRRITPEFVQDHFYPELDPDPNYVYLVVLGLGIMLLWRLAPKGAWISRWPLAFIIGYTAGLRLMGYLESDFIVQAQASIVPLIVVSDGRFSFWLSLQNTVVLLSVLACLTYFFFSIEHRGAVGKTAKVGIWVLMITFGASFAYTVMGRITLLSRRIEFIFDDWLWIIQ